MPEILRSYVRLDHITLLRLGVVSGVSCVHGMTYQVRGVLCSRDDLSGQDGSNM